MLTHLINKIHLINESSSSPHGFDLVKLKDIKPIGKTLIMLSEQLQMQNTFVVVPDHIYHKILARYCKFLYLTYEEYLTNIKHNKNHHILKETSMNTLFDTEGIKQYELTKEEYKNLETDTIDMYKEIDISMFPAELHINSLEFKFAREKYDLFKWLEIFNLIKDYQHKCIINNLEIPEHIKIFNQAFAAQVRSILRDKKIKEAVMKTLKENGYNTELFELNTVRYANTIGTFSYHREESFKFNYPLYYEIKKRGYRITDAQEGEYKK